MNYHAQSLQTNLCIKEKIYEKSAKDGVKRTLNAFYFYTL